MIRIGPDRKIGAFFAFYVLQKAKLYDIMKGNIDISDFGGCYGEGL